MKKFYCTSSILLIALNLSFSSCGVLQKLNNNITKGATIGAGTGAAIGAGIGHVTGKKAGVGAAIGAVVGGIAGGLIGNQMDKQAKELEQQVPEAKIEKVNNGEAIRVTFENGILFGFDNSTLNAQSREALARFATNMKEHPTTDIRIVGHTDSTGKKAYNIQLSQRRAISVFTFLLDNGVDINRMTATGVGPEQPIADNSTEIGRSQNRRVEIFIIPGADMIKDAQKEAEKQ